YIEKNFVDHVGVDYMWSRFELDLDKRPLSHLLLFKQTLSQYVRTIPGDMNISSKTAAKLWRMLNKDQQTYFKKLTKKLIEAEIYRKSAYFIDIKRHNPLFWVFYYGGKRNRQPLEDKDLFHQESLQVPQYLKSSRKNDYNNLEDFNNANENQRNKVDELIQYGARIRDKDDTQSLSSENFNNHLQETSVRDTHKLEYCELYENCWNKDPTIRPGAKFVTESLENIIIQCRQSDQERNVVKHKIQCPTSAINFLELLA
ncbi:24571_t:CDS:2, partial [Gigaspora rosea]